MKKSLTKFFTLLGVFLLLGAGSASADYLNIPGGHNSWNKDQGGVLISNNLGVQKSLPIGDNSFKIRIWHEDNNGWEQWYGVSSNNGTIPLEKWTTLSSPGNDSKIENAKANTNYKVVWNAKNQSVWISEQYPTKIYVVGYVNNGEFNPQNGFELVKKGTSTYEGTLDIGSKCGDAYFSFAEALGLDNDDWTGYGVRYGATSDGFIPTFGQSIGTKEFETNNAFKVPAGNYTISFDLSTQKFTIKQNSVLGPDNLYVYGNVKESSWAEKGYYSAPNENGVFTFKDIYVRGEKPDKNENYIAFFASVDNNADGKMDYESMLPRFGCDVNEATTATNVWVNDFSKDYNLVGYANNNANNFCLPQGIYDIKVDLNTMKISFKDVDLSYQWHDHEGKPIDNDTHEVRYGVDNKIQIGARGDVRHPMADLADFTVEYEPLQSNGGSGVKARAQSVTGNDEFYTIDNDYVMTLNKAGNYTVTASLPDAEGSNFSDVQPATLAVSVAAMDITLNNLDNENQKWSLGATNLELINFDSTSALNDDTFTVTIDTKFDKINSSEAETSMTDWQWAQMNGIMSSNQNVDGYYTEPTFTTSLTANALAISGHFPVSGIYQITVESNDDNITINGKKSDSTSVNIIPNLGLTYDDDYTVVFAGKESEVSSGDCLNIDGERLKNNSITYYYYDGGEDGKDASNLENATLFTPGNYLGTLKYYVSTTESSLQAPDLEDKWVTSVNNIINISELLSADSITLYVLLQKNGLASEIERISVTKVNSSIPTAVDSIEAIEEGEAVYFNLQGVRVDNPERGIFVKVVNGKATKVVM